MKNKEKIQILENRLNIQSKLLDKIITKLELDNEQEELKQLDQSAFEGNFKSVALNTIWQTSLNKRETTELSGSDLCMAMLDRGDTRIMCLVTDDGSRDDITHVIRVYEDGRFHTKANSWKYAVPINNHGEPLTSKDVGL